MKFIVMDHLPDEFFVTDPEKLYTVFEGPTIVHLDYNKTETVFISMMLHGNEHSGYYAVKEYLSNLITKNIVPSKNISLLIGNVEAAKNNARFLDDQKDFNRIWSNGSSKEEVWAQKVYREMSSKNLFATLDLHNNTGKNPHYCAVTNLEVSTLKLASLFDGNVLYFTDPEEVFSNYFSSLCPCLTVEAGQSGDKEGISKIIALIDAVMSETSLSEVSTKSSILSGRVLFESFGKIKIPSNSTISFNGEAADFTFDCSIEELNFNIVRTGQTFGHSHNIHQHLLVYDSNNEPIGSSYFKYVGSEIVSIEDFYPAMITTNSKIVHQDCLCYLLREISPETL